MLHFTLKPWARDREINWDYLSQNENAIDVLTRNQDKIHWDSLSSNPSAIDLLLAHPHKIDLVSLAMNRNPRAMTLLEPRLHELCKDALRLLSENPVAVPLLEKNLQYINWSSLCSNPAAIDLIGQNIEKADWYYLSALEEADDLIHDPRNEAKVYWRTYYSENPHPYAKMRADKMCIIREGDDSNPNEEHIRDILTHIDPASNKYDSDYESYLKYTELSVNPSPRISEILELVDARYLNCREMSLNPSAIPFLEKHQEHIRWDVVWGNPAIFEEAYDYEGMKASTNVFKEELVAAAMHPRRLQMWLAAGGEIDDF